MPIAFYMDVHIPRSITLGLRIRKVDVLTAQEDEGTELADSELLERATHHNRVLFTFDDDLLDEAVKRQRVNTPFAGVIYAHPLHISIGQCVRDLEVIASAGKPEDLQNRIEFLPL